MHIKLAPSRVCLQQAPPHCKLHVRVELNCLRHGDIPCQEQEAARSNKSVSICSVLPLITTLQSAVLTLPGCSDRNKQTSPLLSHHPLLSACVRATNRPKAVSPVCALGTTKAPEQFDPVDSGFGPAPRLKESAASVCFYRFPERLHLLGLFVVCASSNKSAEIPTGSW